MTKVMEKPFSYIAARVPPELYKKFKSKIGYEGKTVQQVVIEWIKEYIEDWQLKEEKEPEEVKE